MARRPRRSRCCAGATRHRLLVHARRGIELQAIIRKWLGGIDWKTSTRVGVDVDPYSFV